MDVYRQASDIVDQVRRGRGTAKALCLRPETEKKRQTYAVVCETIRHAEVLDEILRRSHFFKAHPNADPRLALVLCQDAVFGRGINTRQDETARAIVESTAQLRSSFERSADLRAAKAEIERLRRAAAQAAAEGTGDGAGTAFPRYARVNTLRAAGLGANQSTNPAEDVTGAQESFSSFVARFLALPGLPEPSPAPEQAHGGARRDREADGTPSEAEAKPNNRRGKNADQQPRGPLPASWDAHIPRLLALAPGTDMHAHPLVRRGALVLQDKASCLPAAVLMNAVPVVTDWAERAAEGAAAAPTRDTRRFTTVVDGCAAPGNKTTQLADLGTWHLGETGQVWDGAQPKGDGLRIVAFERDPRRAQLLRSRVAQMAAAGVVTVCEGDFMTAASSDAPAGDAAWAAAADADAILLDPSCSASGVVSRVDVAVVSSALLTGRKDATATGGDTINEEHDNAHGDATEDAGASERVAALARMQTALVTHALTQFPKARRVVYSTCSIHVEEDEAVVAAVLSVPEVQKAGWTLSNIMPGTWPTRGRRLEGGAHAEMPLERTIRCDPLTDRTNGFYVACFDRQLDN